MITKLFKTSNETPDTSHERTEQRSPSNPVHIELTSIPTEISKIIGAPITGNEQEAGKLFRNLLDKTEHSDTHEYTEALHTCFNINDQALQGVIKRTEAEKSKRQHNPIITIVTTSMLERLYALRERNEQLKIELGYNPQEAVIARNIAENGLR